MKTGRRDDVLSDSTVGGTPYSAIVLPDTSRFAIALRVRCATMDASGISSLSAVLSRCLGQDAFAKTGPMLAAEVGSLGGFGITEDGESITVWGICSKDTTDILETIQIVLGDLAIRPRFDDTIVASAKVRLQRDRLLLQTDRAGNLKRLGRANISGIPADLGTLPAIDRRVDLARILAQHRIWFQPSNASITVLGAFEPVAVREAVRVALSVFGWAERSVKSPRATTPLPVTIREQTVHVKGGKGPSRAYLCSGLIPSTRNLASIAADIVACETLTGGRTGTLYALRTQQYALYDVASHLEFSPAGHTLVVEAVSSLPPEMLGITLRAALRQSCANAHKIDAATLNRCKASVLRTVEQRSENILATLLAASARQDYQLADLDRNLGGLVTAVSLDDLVSALRRFERLPVLVSLMP